MDEPAGSYESPLGIVGIDHAACSVRTLQPLCAFYRHVLGFQKFWDVQFHTSDVNPDLPVGSGLLSEAYRHPSSGITFANNEPVAPHFRNSQIDIYCHDNRGAGIQHMAFLTRDILRARENAQRSGGQFLHAPPSYYDRVESRLEACGFKGTLGDEIQSLAEQEILVDGSDKGYLYQVITHSLARHASDDQAGPLFFELIQRAGDDAFGAGNFRALFDEIEQDQIAMQKVAKMLPLELV
jgi:4-hydroxyphenylpyruvate dioxygenase